MMLPVRFSITDKGWVKWPSYGKSKGKSIRSCDHLRGKHTQGRKTRVYRPWQCERPFSFLRALTQVKQTGGTTLRKLAETQCDSELSQEGALIIFFPLPP